VTQPLEPTKCDILVSKFAFEWLNLYRYTTEEAEAKIRDELAAIMNDSDAHAENLRADATEKSVAEDATFEVGL
jgi:hypothetical protein